MKRALAERARGEHGGSSSGAPSPTKKFARFGGGGGHVAVGNDGSIDSVGNQQVNMVGAPNLLRQSSPPREKNTTDHTRMMRGDEKDRLSGCNNMVGNGTHRVDVASRLKRPQYCDHNSRTAAAAAAVDGGVGAVTALSSDRDPSHLSTSSPLPASERDIQLVLQQQQQEHEEDHQSRMEEVARIAKDVVALRSLSASPSRDLGSTQQAPRSNAVIDESTSLPITEATSTTITSEEGGEMIDAEYSATLATPVNSPPVTKPSIVSSSAKAASSRPTSRFVRRMTSRTISTPAITTIVMPTQSGDEDDANDGDEHHEGGRYGTNINGGGPTAITTGTSAPSSTPTISKRYYLQYQNRALLTELHRVKHELNLLEDERMYRRKTCKKAQMVVDNVHGWWHALEVALIDSLRSAGGAGGAAAVAGCGDETRETRLDLPPPSPPRQHSSSQDLLNHSTTNDNGSKMRGLAAISIASPCSTGSASDVETVGGLVASIIRLAKSTATTGSTSHVVKNEVLANFTSTPLGPDDAFDDAVLVTSLAPLKDRIENMTLLLLRYMESMKHFYIPKQNNMIMHQHQKTHTDDPSTTRSSISSSSSLVSVTDQLRRIAILEGQLKSHELQIVELSDSRVVAMTNEKKIRRYLNRILAGQSASEVLRDVEGFFDDHCSSDYDGNLLPVASFSASKFSPAKIRRGGNGGVISRSNNTSGDVDEDGSSSAATTWPTTSEDHEEEEGADLHHMSAKDKDLLERCKLQLDEIHSVAQTRQDRIDTLMSEREEMQKRINSLILPTETSVSVTNADSDDSNSTEDMVNNMIEWVRRHPLYQDMSSNCKVAIHRKAHLEKELEVWKNKVAVKAGEVDFLQKAIDEQLIKFERRWKEVVASDGGENCGEREDLNAEMQLALPSRLPPVQDQGAQLVAMQHKLNQALEGARRVEVYRSALNELSSIVETLQQQGLDWRGKYQAAVAQNKLHSSSSFGTTMCKAESGATSLSSTTTATRTESVPPQPTSSSIASKRESTGGNSESRYQKENRRLKKEFATLQQSRESAKIKVERLTNERDNLLKSNSRLTSQSTEKDEINADSLSTILHLKHQLVLRTEEVEVVEKKKKNLEQLALASRLAANAHDRAIEEERSATLEMEQNLDEARKGQASLLDSIQERETNVEQFKHRVETLESDLEATRARCDELASESNNSLENKSRVAEELNVALKQVSEMKKQLEAKGRGGSHGGGGRGSGVAPGVQFTAEQLTTQLSVLKGRLACPVCNHRDKSCILLRCRHMFCRQCVDNSIKNRSRKCPACGTRFDTKDVGEIWL